MSQIITKGLLSAKSIVKGFFGKILQGEPINTVFIPCNITTEINIPCKIITEIYVRCDI